MIDESALKYLQAHLGNGLTLFTDAKDGQYSVPLLSMPNDVGIHSLEKHLINPSRIKATATLKSTASFCEYINRYAEDDSSVYIDTENGAFVAYLDHHGEKQPRWRSHIATFKPRLSIEWKSWKAIHNKPISQLELALHIEKMLDTVDKPEPNEMLKAALDFQTNEDMTLASKHNLDNGATNFVFKRGDITSSVEFPHRITLLMPIYENEPAESHECRVRYKVNGDGFLVFTFSFVKDPAMLERESMLFLAERTHALTNGLHHYEGGLSA